MLEIDTIKVSKEAGKGKEDLSNLTKKELEIQEKTTAEVATLRAELAVLDRQTKETNDERQKILKVYISFVPLFHSFMY